MDPLLAALIGKLPAVPAGAKVVWPGDDREAWLNLMRLAFDVVYGRGEGDGRGAVVDMPSDFKLAAVSAAAPAPDAMPAEFQRFPVGRFYVEADGTAKSPRGNDAHFETIPIGTVLLDYRAPGASMQLATIIWADGTWPASHVSQRELRLDQVQREAA